MTPERWQQIRDLLDSAIPLAPAEWSAFLDQHCSSDPALRQEVERLLDTEGNVPPSFLESPVLEQLPEQQEACMRFVGTPLFGNIVSGAYAAVLAKHSEHLSMEDVASADDSAGEECGEFQFLG